ncbi:MAG: hypothetical protein MJ238_04445 [Bacilli bacterium]|nr:hypothetical protein [Bacilli bacterium]
MEIITNYLNETTFITLSNDKGLKVVLSDCGASIYEISLDGIPMTKAEKDLENWMKSPSYAGKTVGRIAGRIKDGVLVFDGETYELDKNENNKTCHHGGDRRFAFSTWSYNLETYPNAIAVLFSKEDKDSKFPGNIIVNVRYIIYKNENVVRIEYKTTSDKKTPINLTNHTYFSLGEESLDSMNMILRAKDVALYDDDLIATKMRTCPEYLDFSTGKEFKDIWGAKELKNKRLLGLDHAFKFSEFEAPLILRGSKYKLILSTSLPGVHLYSENFIVEGEVMNDDSVAKTHASLAIEPQYMPGDYNAMSVEENTIKEDYIEYRFIKF